MIKNNKMRDFMIETSYLRNDSIPKNENEKINYIPEPINNYSSGNNSANKMKNFLKETAELRKNMISDVNVNYNVNKNSSSSASNTLKSLPANFSNSNYSNSNGSWYSNNSSSNNNLNDINSSNFESRVKYLSDFDFKNPDYNMINSANFKVNDQIGRKCLELTNEFRKKHRMPLLK